MGPERFDPFRERKIKLQPVKDLLKPVPDLLKARFKRSIPRGRFFLAVQQQIGDFDVLREPFPRCGSNDEPAFRIAFYDLPYLLKLSRIGKRCAAEFCHYCSHIDLCPLFFPG